MFDIIVYYKDGTRAHYDRVAQLTNIADNLVIDFITGFNYRIEKPIKMDNVESIKVKKYEKS